MLLLFGDCALDPDRRELTRDSIAIPTGPQVFDLLFYLIANRTRLVSKDDLLETVWRGRVVSDSTIASHVNAARAAIGDNGQEQRLIRTIARKGFRFVAEVTEVWPSADRSNVAAAGGSTPRADLSRLPFVTIDGGEAAGVTVATIIASLPRPLCLLVIVSDSACSRILGPVEAPLKGECGLTASKETPRLVLRA